MQACADAEARGDLAGAVAHTRDIPDRAGSFHVGRLDQLAELGDHAPAWMWSRWIALQAGRPLWSDATEAELDLTDFERAFSIAYPHGLDPHWLPMLTQAHQRDLVVEHDWMVHQVVVHESGRLSRFVRDRAGSALLAGADRPDEWASAPLGAYRLEPSERGAVVLRDLGDGSLCRVLDLGLALVQDVGQHLLGRLVPISVAPGLMLDRRPLAVDAATARAVAADPDRWVDVVAARARSRLLPMMFGYHEADLVSDSFELAWVYALLGDDWESWLVRPDGCFHIDDAVPFAIDRLLGAVVADPGSVRRVLPVVRDLLNRPGVDRAVRSGHAGPEHARAWSVLASLLDEPAAGRCRAWASHT